MNAYHVEFGMLQVTMSSATSDVTYTSVYSDSEPGRAFWAADYEEVPEITIRPQLPDPSARGRGLRTSAMTYSITITQPPTYLTITTPAGERLARIASKSHPGSHCAVTADALTTTFIYHHYHHLYPYHHLLTVRDDIPESEQPPRKRLYLSTIGSRYEIGESPLLRPAIGQGSYGYVSTVDCLREATGDSRMLGTRIRDTWRPVWMWRREGLCFPTYLHAAQQDTATAAEYSHSDTALGASSNQDMRARDERQCRLSLLALREPQRRLTVGPEARISDHQEELLGRRQSTSVSYVIVSC
ncbi:hypothetical protein Tco_1043142 [Tanacetum coccineum]|uniref:Uncharacterized protein n=1 Tax=Tanacetum coccineum TaxID=301880 RepID=A0ABQ5GNE8_9ASTR